jgi:hypothetical protein
MHLPGATEEGDGRPVGRVGVPVDIGLDHIPNADSDLYQILACNHTRALFLFPLLAQNKSCLQDSMDNDNSKCTNEWR